jgi:hypothetical protein
LTTIYIDSGTLLDHLDRSRHSMMAEVITTALHESGTPRCAAQLRRDTPILTKTSFIQ